MNECEHEWTETIIIPICKWRKLHQRYVDRSSIEAIIDFFWEINRS